MSAIAEAIEGMDVVAIGKLARITGDTVAAKIFAGLFENGVVMDQPVLAEACALAAEVALRASRGQL